MAEGAPGSDGSCSAPFASMRVQGMNAPFHLQHTCPKAMSCRVRYRHRPQSDVMLAPLRPMYILNSYMEPVGFLYPNPCRQQIEDPKS